MAQPTPLAPAHEAFRTAFHRARRELIGAHGPEAFDQAQVLYADAETGRQIVIRDAFPRAFGIGPIDAFVERLNRDWWRGRQTFSGDGGDGLKLVPVAGLYAHYLPEVGFDYSIEFAPGASAPAGEEGPDRAGGAERDEPDPAGEAVAAWRMDARGRVTRLSLPKDEGMFRDQAGAFFDLRAGWRWLVERHQATGAHRPTGELQVAEVQSGYIIGVRAGVPGDPDPAAREDDELAHAFSRFDIQRFDTLEFLGSPEAARYPFVGERYVEWLGAAAPAVEAGEIEPFVLADASEYLAAIEDLASQRGVAVAWIDPEDDIKVGLVKGPLRTEMAFSYPYLRTLHTARSFVEGASAFFGPFIDAIDEAHDLWTIAKEKITGYDLRIEHGVVLVVSERGTDVPVGRWPLLNLVGRDNEHGAARVESFFQLLGYDPQTGTFADRSEALDTCPISGEPARVGKVIRPSALLGVDPRTLAGVEVGQHVVYYTVESARHVTPVERRPGRTLADLEAAYRAGLESAATTLLVHRRLPEATDALLLVGHDVGSLVLEPARLKAALEAVEAPTGGEHHVYAFFADAMVIAPKALTGEALRRARLAALEATQPHFPARVWPLDVVRIVTLGPPPAGRVELVS